jgi:hypothetical protein
MGQRVLVTSTTNAAVDQALASLATLDDGRAAIDRGDVVRLGQTQADMHGAGLRQVVDRLSEDTHRRIATLEERRVRRLRQLAAGQAVSADLEANADAAQLGLFSTTAVPPVGTGRLAGLFRESYARRLAARPLNEQRRLVERRLARLD